ncbi:MAG: ABC transporter substrate-binding protein, partial [Phyllobacterium sp.]|uniref:ABC transporter substrate-binding protein n=1 Tax=Phyllobacterium sp. TaxID=1871046 RepID=UPI0030F084AC
AENISIECRSAGKHDSGLAAAAADLVQLPVDVIVTSSQPAAHAAHEATHVIPIVTIISGDPVAAGLASSIAKPGGNVTGVSYYATELAAKRLELLKEAVPGVAIVGVLANPAVSYLPFEADTKDAARRLGILVKIQQVSEPDELEAAFSRMEAEGAQAVFVLPDLMLADQSSRIAALAIEHRLPTMAWGPWYTEDGCLMAYSARYSEMNHRLAFYVDRILKGAKPGDLPIEQPTKFELSINLKTANAAPPRESSRDAHSA